MSDRRVIDNIAELNGLVAGAGITITLGTDTVTIAAAPGAGGDLFYTHTQATPSKSWLMVHNLGKFPSVTAIASDGSIVIGSVTYLDLNSLLDDFSAEMSGVAYLN